MLQNRQVFLHAWIVDQDDGGIRIYWERSTERRCRHDATNKAGIRRGKHRVTVFCSYTHGQGALSKQSLRNVARWHLDGEFKVTEIDLSS